MEETRTIDELDDEVQTVQNKDGSSSEEQECDL